MCAFDNPKWKLNRLGRFGGFGVKGHSRFKVQVELLGPPGGD